MRMSPTSVGCDGPASSIIREAAVARSRRITAHSEAVNGRSTVSEVAILSCSVLLDAAFTKLLPLRTCCFDAH